MYPEFQVLLVDDEVFFCNYAAVDLQSDWRSVSAYGRLQDLGSAWYLKNEKLVLRVPSVLIPQESNFVINTKNKYFWDFVRLKSVEDFGWDERFKSF